MLKPFWSVSNTGISGAGFFVRVTLPQVRTGAPTAASTQCLTIGFTSGVRPPGGNFSTYLHFQKKEKREEKKKEKPML